MSTMKWNEAKSKLLEDPATRNAYESPDLAFEIGKMITDARIATRTTQTALARKLGTKQPSIARIENGNSLPSLSFLDRIASALGTKLLAPQFEMFVEERVVVVHYKYRVDLVDSPLIAVATNGEMATTSTQKVNQLLGGAGYGYVTS